MKRRTLERLRKYCSRTERGFSSICPATAGFGEGAGLKNPLIEPERGQKTKKTLNLFFFPCGYHIFEIALKVRDGKYRVWGVTGNVWRRPFVFSMGLVPLFLVLAFGMSSTQAQSSREYQLKAVFLYNFAQFTDWPTNTFAATNSPIVIGILGQDPFGPALPDTVTGETIHGHPFVIEHYRRAEDIKTCDILFISQSETRRVNEIVRSLKGKPILTVADADTPSTSGAIIRFLIQNNKVHFRVNEKAAEEANITLSSKLLRVADVVPPEKEK